MKNNKRLILLELNEINFELLKKYVDASPGKFTALERLFNWHGITTEAEKKYDLLEPWIQWPSVHSVKTFEQHKVFRLGDITAADDVTQIYEILETADLRVGAVSPMNGKNVMKAPGYFIPDPWTTTPTDGMLVSQALDKMLKQTVNDNAKGTLTLRSIVVLVLALIRFARISNWPLYLRLLFGSFSKRWYKSLFLDLFLSDLHVSLFCKKNVDFSTLFLNAGAHIQHHYMHSSKYLVDDRASKNPSWYIRKDDDPLEDMAMVYDKIVGHHFEIPRVEIIIATGLSQIPTEKPEFYYRHVDHEGFLTKIGVAFKSVHPRMTRDFLIFFNSLHEALAAQQILSDVYHKSTGKSFFGEIDNRGLSLFVTLTFDEQIGENDKITLHDQELSVFDQVTFVAIKNAKHFGLGYAFFSSKVAAFAPASGLHVKNIGLSVLRFFGVSAASEEAAPAA